MSILNIAHRGFTGIYPDNTLEAFESAIEIGADGIELDIQETADNYFVVHHDSSVNGVNLNRISLNQVRDIKIKGKFRIPTLEEVLSNFGKRIILIVELKRVHSLKKLIELIRSGSIIENIILASFNKELIVELSKMYPKLRRGIIVGVPFGDTIKIVRSAEANVLMIRFSFLTQKLVEQIHAINRDIYVWGVANPRLIIKAISFDIEAIISDFPDQVYLEIKKGKI